MKIKKSQLKEIIREGIKAVLKEKKKPVIKEDKMTPEQMKFAKPIFQAAAKKGGFKIKKIYMSFRPQAEIIVYNYGKDTGNMYSVWGETLTQAEAQAIGKAIEKNDKDWKMGDSAYRPKFKFSKDTDYLDLYEAAEYAGVRYDDDEYDRLFRKK